MQIAKTIKQVRAATKSARRRGKTIGLVPTMGALHKGHTSLIEAAADKTDYIVLSIFVNPTQFAPSEDFTQYPRPVKKDLQIARRHNVDLLFTPESKEIYPQQQLIWLNVRKLTETLCGQSRPNHFQAVATICAKLFNITTPDFAFFGQKDAQQAVVIKRMVADLNMPLKIVICPTVREADGLAVSSRNNYLNQRQRKHATLLYQSLKKAKSLIERGEKNCETIIEQMRRILEKSPLINIEYISLADAETLQNLQKIHGTVLVAVAARLGTARLIDNITVDAGKK